MEDKQSLSLPGEIIIEVSGEKIIVKKLGLIKYSQLTLVLKDLIESFIEIFQKQDLMAQEQEMSPEQKQAMFSSSITELINKDIVQVIKFLHICIPDVEIKFIEEKVGIFDAIKLVNAILEANEIVNSLEEVKKLMTTLLGNKR